MKTKRKRDNILTKRNKVLIDRDNVNAKRKKIIDLLNETLINEINKRKNDDAEFKLKKKKIISFEIVTTTEKKKKEEMIMKKKASIENNDFYILKIFDVKNSTE